MERLLEHLRKCLEEFATKLKCRLQELQDGRWKQITTGKFSVKEIRYGLNSKQYIKYLTLGIGIVLAVSYLFYETFWAALILAPYVHFFLLERGKENRNKKRREKTIQFKDGMLAVSFALNVGYSMENAFKEAIHELELLYGTDSDIVLEFQSLVRRVQRNENIEDAMEDYASQSEVEDILYFSEVFRYAKRSGGDMISIIKNTARMIQEKTEVYEEIQTVISGKKMEQNIMSLIPFGIIVYLKMTAEEFINPLYGNVTGIVTMSVCLILYLAADYMAKRIIAIEV